MSKGTVLVADDDRAIRTVLTQALARAGFDVRAGDTAASLWQWVSNCLLYTSPSPRDRQKSRMPSST